MDVPPETPSARNIPRHTAIIMDGNGRWANQRGFPRIFGHERGGENLLRVVEAAGDLGIEILTVYAFSVENWQRPDDEVSGLMRLLAQYLARHAQTLIKRQVRLRAIGDIEALPEHARRPLLETIKATESFTKQTLVLALNYGSRAEIVRATQQIASEVSAGTLAPESLDWKAIAARLDTAGIPDPDLVIRTSGEVRLSNFLLLQAAYAEWFFTDVLWPDFSAEELAKAVRAYSSRERRFGQTSAQLTPAA